MSLRQFLLNLGATTLATSALISAAAYVARHAIERWFAQGLERYKAGLQRVAFEHQTRFAKLHDQRAEIIAQLYRQMDRIRQLWEASARALRFNVEESPDQQRAEASRLCLTLTDFYYQNKLFLEEDLCTAMEHFLLEAQQVWLTHGDWSAAFSSGPGQDPAAAIAHKMMIDQANRLIQDRLQPAMQLVETRMRAILGIEGTKPDLGLGN